MRDVELTSSHTYIKNTSTYGAVLTEHLRKLAENLIQPELQERSPCNRQDEGKREKRRCGEGPCTPGGSYDRGKAASPWGPPSLARSSAGRDRGLQRLERKVCELVCGPTRQKETSTDGPGHITVLPSPRCTPAGVCSDWLQQTDLEGQLGLVIQREPKRSFWPQKGRSQLLLCVDFCILSMENHKDTTQKLLLIELIKDFSKVAGHKINIQKLAAFLHTSSEISERECLKKKKKYLLKQQSPK